MKMKIYLWTSLLLFFPSGLLASQPIFDTWTTYELPDRNITSLVAADFDKDGDLDFVTANYYNYSDWGNTISVLENAGDGSIASRVDYDTPYGPFALVVGDFNDDGAEDIALTSSSVSIFINRGDGSFYSRVDYVVGENPLSITVADLNSDGHDDLVTANSGGPGNTISVLMNGGDGSFAPAVSYLVELGSRAVAAGDFDRDGHLDLAVACFLGECESKISVLKNQGDGTFAGRVNYPIYWFVSSLIASDLNGDDYPDLISTSIGCNAAESTVTVLMNGGDGTFFNSAIYKAEKNPIAVAAADYDGDGKVDLVTANTVSSSISVLKNSGDGTFDSIKHYHVGSVPRGFVAADLNGDRTNDLAVCDVALGLVSILRNNGSGEFSRPSEYATQEGPGWVTASDLNGDGFQDLVVANSGTGYGYYYGRTISAYLNNRDSTFGNPIEYQTGLNPRSIFAGDIDGDSDQDLIVANTLDNSISVLKNDGNGGLDNRTNYTIGYPQQPIAADVDGDGDQDLIVAAAPGLSVYLNDGIGNFTFNDKYLPSITINSVVAADFNGDQWIDLAATDLSRIKVLVLLNDGNGVFHVPTEYEINGLPTSIAAADFDHDGYTDLTVTTHIRQVRVFLNRSDGTFSPGVIYQTGTRPSAMCVADFDEDGYADITTTNWDGTSVSFFKNRKNGTFVDAVNYGAGLRPMSIAAADLDGDGDQDLAIANQLGNNVSILRNLSRCISVRGDLDADSVLTTVDVVLLLNAVFVGVQRQEICSADSNCDGKLSPSDVVIELNAVFLSVQIRC